MRVSDSVVRVFEVVVVPRELVLQKALKPQLPLGVAPAPAVVPLESQKSVMASVKVQNACSPEVAPVAVNMSNDPTQSSSQTCQAVERLPSIPATTDQGR